MAGANKRTSVILAVLAVVFVVIIIILCLVPQPCHGPDCHCTGPDCQHGQQEKHGSGPHADILTDSPTEVTTSVSTTTTAPTTTMHLETTKPTMLSSTTEKSTTLSSTTEQSTTSSTTTKHIHIVSSTTETPTTEIQTTDDPTLLSSPTVSSTTLSTTSDYYDYESYDLSTEDPTEETTTTIGPSEEPITMDATSEEPSTTTATSEEQSTMDATSEEPSTTATSEEPSTTTATSEEPSTTTATSEEPSTMDATSEEPTTTATSEEPTSMIASSEEPSTTTATSEEPTTMIATSEEPSTTIATSEEPSTTTTTSEEPTTTIATSEETTILSSTEESTTLSSTSEEPTTEPSTTDDSTTVLSSTVSSTTTVYYKLSNETCNTISCKRLAARMLDMMDLGNINPCEDFYAYACGGVLDDPFLTPEDPQLVTHHLIKEALARVPGSDPDVGPMREYYNSCLNYTEMYNETTRLEQARDFFNNISIEFNPNVKGIAKTSDELPGFNNDFNFTSCLAKMMKLHFAPLFDLHVDVDGNDTGRFVLKLTPPVFGSPFSDDLAHTVCLHNHTLRLENATLTNQIFDINEEYEVFQHCKSRGAGLQARLETMSLAVNEMKLMENIINITLKEKLLANTKISTNFFLESLAEYLPQTPDMRRVNINKAYKEFTLAELSDGSVFTYIKDEIDWEALLEELTGEVMGPQTVVQVYFHEELDEIFYLISQELDDPINLQNILLLLWSERVYTDLVKPVGAPLSTPEYCYRATTSLMEDFTSYLYMDTLPNLTQRHDKIKDMIRIHKKMAEDQLKRRFSDPRSPMIEKLRLMSGETADLKVIKQIAQDNMKNVNLYDNFMDNSKVLLERYRTLMHRMYHRPTTEPQVMWSQFLLPYDSYGVTSYALNKFFIPYAALEAPLFFDDVPKYINYAGIGHMIAHEFAHGFDAIGIMYNGTQKVNKPMEGINHYLNITDCLKMQLEQPQKSTSVTGLQSHLNIQRNLVFNEVMADSAATRLAWEAYLSDVNAVPPQPTQTAPLFGGRNTVNRRKRWVKQAEDSTKRQKRQASPNYLPSTDSPEKKLPWLNLTPIQTYFVRNAQNHCSKTSQVDMLTAMENEHLPGRLRVNIILRNEPLFAKAFDCHLGSSKMSPDEQCPFILG